MIPGQRRLKEDAAVEETLPAVTGRTIDLARLEPLVAELTALLDDSDIQSATLAGKLVTLLKNTDFGKEIATVASSIEGYDFEKAKDDLKTLASRLGVTVVHDPS